jgi:hypothetical protein
MALGDSPGGLTPPPGLPMARPTGGPGLPSNAPPPIQQIGLMQIRTPAQVTADMDKAQNPQMESPFEVFDVGAVKHSEVVSRISAGWSRNKRAKMQIEQRILNCMRARNGEYSAAELQEIQASGANSAVYVPIAATKCRALAAWLKEILMAPGSRPCGLEARLVPDLPPEIDAVIQTHAASKARAMMGDVFGQTGQTLSEDDFKEIQRAVAERVGEEVRLETKRRAKMAAQKMEDVVYTKLDEGDFDEANGEFIEYFSFAPTAFMKGPYEKNAKVLGWGPNWQPMVETKTQLAFRAFHPLDAYPAQQAKSCQERDFIERLRITEAELESFKGIEGYDDDAIDWVLNQQSTGGLVNWIWTDGERAQLQHSTTFNFSTEDGLIDALHFWGSISGRILKAWGVKGVDSETRRYEVDAIMIGTRIVRLAINSDPLGLRPYFSASYEEVPGSIWGRGVPELCESSQSMANAAARALDNNMGIASGPQVWVNVDRLPVNQQEVTTMVPWKMWFFNRDESSTSGTQSPPMGFFQPTSNAQELMQIFQNWNQIADDDTGIPRYSYGNQEATGAAATSSGLSMLMGAAAKGVRRAIGAIDRVLCGVVYGVWVWCMLYVDDQEIKGDCQIIPRGSSQLLIKEQVQQQHLQALQLIMSSPLLTRLASIRTIADTLREVLVNLHLPSDAVLDGPELEAVIQSIENPQPGPEQMPPAAIAAQGNLQLQQAKNESREKIEKAKIIRDLSVASHRAGNAKAK